MSGAGPASDESGNLLFATGNSGGLDLDRHRPMYGDGDRTGSNQRPV